MIFELAATSITVAVKRAAFPKQNHADFCSLLNCQSKHTCNTALSYRASATMMWTSNEKDNGGISLRQSQIPFSLLSYRQRQQYRTRIKVIDFDQFTPEAMAEKEEKLQREYIKRHKKKISREQRQRNREKLEAEEKTKYIFRYDIWEETIENLLKLDTYPVGFSNSSDNTMISSWCQQISHTLQQTLSLNASVSLELVFQLLDRLFAEQQAHKPDNPSAVEVLMSPDISSSAIECALKSWKFSLLYPPHYEQMTVADVQRAQERVLFYSNFLAKHEDSMLEQISKLLDVDRIVNTKTTTTNRLLWGHIPHTVHPNAIDANAKIYLKYINVDEEEGN